MTKFHKRLAEAFIHPVENYELVGESEGQSACACGHPIRNIFTVACDGHIVELGSECIETYAGLENVRQQVQVQREREKELLKAQKEQMENAELQAILAEYNALLAPFKQKMQNGVRIPYEIYRIIYGGLRLGQLKSLKGKIARVQKELKKLKVVIDAANAA